jgi:ABC-type transporter Mla subunit MlaD
MSTRSDRWALRLSIAAAIALAGTVVATAHGATRPSPQTRLQLTHQLPSIEMNRFAPETNGA